MLALFHMISHAKKVHGNEPGKQPGNLDVMSTAHTDAIVG